MNEDHQPAVVDENQKLPAKTVPVLPATVDELLDRLFYRFFEARTLSEKADKIIDRRYSFWRVSSAAVSGLIVVVLGFFQSLDTNPVLGLVKDHYREDIEQAVLDEHSAEVSRLYDGIKNWDLKIEQYIHDKNINSADWPKFPVLASLAESVERRGHISARDIELYSDKLSEALKERYDITSVNLAGKGPLPDEAVTELIKEIHALQGGGNWLNYSTNFLENETTDKINKAASRPLLAILLFLIVLFTWLSACDYSDKRWLAVLLTDDGADLVEERLRNYRSNVGNLITGDKVAFLAAEKDGELIQKLWRGGRVDVLAVRAILEPLLQKLSARGVLTKALNSDSKYEISGTVERNGSTV